MTQGPETPDPNEQPGWRVGPAAAATARPPPPPPAVRPARPAAVRPGPARPAGRLPAAAGGYAPNPAAPYGVHPVTGIPYSDKSKLVAGLLQILLGGFGIGRFYIGDTKIGVWQIVVTILTCGIGALWGLIDGIMMLANDTVTDAQGRPLRNG